MLRKLLGTMAMTAALALSAACGGGDDPAAQGETDQGNGSSAAQARVEAPPPAETRIPAPTRPQRIDAALLTPTAAPPKPTAQPGAANTTGGESTTTGRTPESTEPTVGPGGIADLIPTDPRFTDQVLLQDIYARIDLNQFALDPEDPIEFGYKGPAGTGLKPVEVDGDAPLMSTMEYPMVHEHPFLHLFPSVEEGIVDQERPDDLKYHPSKSTSVFHPSHEEKRFANISAGRNGLINFIYQPWFHPVQPRKDWQWAIYGAGLSRQIEMPRVQVPANEKYQPFWFGENSTKGVLLETVAKLIEEAQHPGVEPAQRAWWTKPGLPERESSLDLRDWTLEEYLSTAVNTDDPVDSGRRQSIEERSRKSGAYTHIMPQVNWEILHPKLPIVRVTVHSEHALPLTPAGVDSLAQYARDQRSRYSVSFVMSFQNRWTSFDDPNRWIIRFKDDLDIYLEPPWKLDESLPYPDYWDDTDYMQHRIIGPVVMTVHEPRPPSRQGLTPAPVLQPGNYSMTPRIREWTAPGHILTDRQVPTEKRKIILSHGGISDKERLEDQGFRQWPVIPGPDAGFPLPGHVLTTRDFGHGSDLWRERDMDGNDW